jgi:hypothetical protein
MVETNHRWMFWFLSWVSGYGVWIRLLTSLNICVLLSITPKCPTIFSDYPLVVFVVNIVENVLVIAALLCLGWVLRSDAVGELYADHNEAFSHYFYGDESHSSKRWMIPFADLTLTLNPLIANPGFIFVFSSCMVGWYRDLQRLGIPPWVLWFWTKHNENDSCDRRAMAFVLASLYAFVTVASLYFLVDLWISEISGLVLYFLPPWLLSDASCALLYCMWTNFKKRDDMIDEQPSPNLKGVALRDEYVNGAGKEVCCCC